MWILEWGLVELKQSGGHTVVKLWAEGYWDILIHPFALHKWTFYMDIGMGISGAHTKWWLHCGQTFGRLLVGHAPACTCFCSFRVLSLLHEIPMFHY